MTVSNSNKKILYSKPLALDTVIFHHSALLRTNINNALFNNPNPCSFSSIPSLHCLINYAPILIGALNCCRCACQNCLNSPSSCPRLDSFL